MLKDHPVETWRSWLRCRCLCDLCRRRPWMPWKLFGGGPRLRPLTAISARRPGCSIPALNPLAIIHFALFVAEPETKAGVEERGRGGVLLEHSGTR